MGLSHTPNENPIALHVDDITAARARLTARGVACQSEILDTGVCHRAFFRDPDGDALMLHRPLRPARAGRLTGGRRAGRPPRCRIFTSGT